MRIIGFGKHIDDMGRIVIPKDAKKALGWRADDQLEFLMDEQNKQIILRKVDITCLKCGATDELREIKPLVALCRKCIKTLIEEDE